MPDGSRTIVDAHVHVIEHIAGLGRKGEFRAIGKGRARWPDGEEVRLIPDGWGDRAFTHDKLIEVMDEHGISKAILMQGSYYGFCNDYTFEAQERHPDRLFGMGTFDPYAYEAERIMERLTERFKFRGLKFELSRGFGLMGYHPDFRLDSRMMAPVWEFVRARGLVISLDLGTFGEPSLQVEDLSRIAARHPGISFVVEHIFFPGPARFDEARRALAVLAPRENVAVTVASIPISTLPEPYPYASARRYVGIAKELLGADRILWGSDLPSVAVFEPYSHLIDYLRDSGLFDDDELGKVYAGNAARIYGL